VDLLVEEGFYASRTDFIRAAVRRLLDEHKSFLEDAATRREFSVGVVKLGASYLETVRKKKERLELRVVGVLELRDDVTPELADQTIERVNVLGSFRAPPAVIERLGARVSKKRGIDG